MTTEDKPQEATQHAPEKTPEKVEVDQDILRARVDEHRPPVKEYFKRPYLVWTGMPPEFTHDKDLAEQESVPETLRNLGPTDGTTYSADELNKKYRNGGIIIQPDGKGGLEAYPVKAEGIEMNTKLPSEKEALNLNPELAKMISESSDLNTLVESGQVIGMVRSAPARMIKLSDIGYSRDMEVVLPGKGAGQRKPAGEDAYLGIGKDKQGQEVYWIINCDKDGLPVNYLQPEDIKRAQEPTTEE